MKVDTRIKNAIQADIELKNEYISILVGADGRFNSGATGDITDDRFNLIFNWPSSPWSSFTSIWIDGTVYIFGSEGEMIQPPTNIQSEGGRTINVCIWKYGDIYVTQTLEICFNPFDNRDDNGGYIYTVHNAGTIAHQVGVRVMIDTMVNGNDGIPFSITGQTGLITTEKELFNEGSLFNSFSWYTLYSFETPQIGSQGDVQNKNYYGVHHYVAPLPDRFAFCAWRNIRETNWEYTIDPAKSIVGDSAIAYWWNPMTLEPDSGFNCVSHMGLNNLKTVGSVGVSAPEQLQLTATGWSPNPFTLYVAVFNNTTESLNDVEVSISVEEPGLRILNSNEAMLEIKTNKQAIRGTKIIYFPQILPGNTAQAAVSVEARQPGNWGYSVTALGSTVTGTVQVPAQPVEQANVKITKSSTVSNIYIGSELEYSILVENISTSTANNVTVVDNLPMNVEFINTIVSQGNFVLDGSTIEWKLGGLAAGTQATAKIKVKPLKIGMITNRATVYGDNVPSNPDINISTVSSKVKGTLGTGPIVKDKCARSLVISINNTTDAPVTIEIILRQTQCCIESERTQTVTIPANCIKNYIWGCIPTVYELIFKNVEEGVYIWTDTRIEDSRVSGKCSSFIAANRLVHSELIQVK